MEQGIATTTIGRLFRVQSTSGILCKMGCVKVREVAKNSAAKLLFEDKIVQKMSRSSREPEQKKNCLRNSVLGLLHCWILCFCMAEQYTCTVHVREINVHVQPSRGM